MEEHVQFPATIGKFLQGLLLVFVVAAVGLAITIPILGSQVLFEISNYLQIIAAVLGLVVALVLWKLNGKGTQYLYAAGAFGIWAVSNAAWYVGVLFGMKSQVFPSLIDMGFLAFMFLMASAYQYAFPRSKVSPKISLGILVLLLIIPVTILIMKGITAATMMVFLYFFFAAALLIIGLAHSMLEKPLVLAGSLAYCIAFTLYPLREARILSDIGLGPLGELGGPLTIISFSLIILAFLPKMCPCCCRDA